MGPTRPLPLYGGDSVNLHLTTLNVNGLGGPSKRRAVFNFLRGQVHDIYFLQETHCTGGRERIWTSEWGGRAFLANGSSEVRGVAILLSPSSPIVVQEVKSDPEGRFLLLQAKCDEWPIT